MAAEIDYEAEYNNRARVPEHPALIEGWARDAKAWRERQGFRTISYAPGARHTIDVFASRGKGDLVMFIHGGYWQALDGSFFSHLAAGLNAHGVSVAIPGYDLCPQVSVDDIIRQMRMAARELAQPCDVPAVSGACFATTPALWQALGGFEQPDHLRSLARNCCISTIPEDGRGALAMQG